jgi:hypothetical protein
MSKYSPEERRRRSELMKRLNREGKCKPFAGRNPDGSFRRRGDPKPSARIIPRSVLGVDDESDELDSCDAREQAARAFRRMHQRPTHYRTGSNPGGFYL